MSLNEDRAVYDVVSEEQLIHENKRRLPSGNVYEG